MKRVTDLIEALQNKHGGISFQKICKGEGITAIKDKLPEGCNEAVLFCDGRTVIILSDTLPHQERREKSWHAIYHILQGSPLHVHGKYSKREDKEADIFAALCLIPSLREGDTPDSLVERCGVSRELALVRIRYELKRSGQ